MKDATGSFEAGLLAMAGFLVMSTVVALTLKLFMLLPPCAPLPSVAGLWEHWRIPIYPRTNQNSYGQESDINAGFRRDPNFVEAVAAKTVLGRWGTAGDIAAVVAFLASPDAAWVTGQIIEASGGFNLSH